jgi:excisionase family DNA binding protein
MTSQPPPKRYYRVDEVAVYFSISIRTVYRLIDDGIMSGTKIRKCVRVSIEEIKRFEESILVTDD